MVWGKRARERMAGEDGRGGKGRERITADGKGGEWR